MQQLCLCHTAHVMWNKSSLFVSITHIAQRSRSSCRSSRRTRQLSFRNMIWSSGMKQLGSTTHSRVYHRLQSSGYAIRFAISHLQVPQHTAQDATGVTQHFAQDAKGCLHHPREYSKAARWHSSGAAFFFSYRGVVEAMHIGKRIQWNVRNEVTGQDDKIGLTLRWSNGHVRRKIKLSTTAG